MSEIFKIMRGLINVIYPSLLTLDKKCTDFWRMYSAWSPIYVFAFVLAKKECYHSAQSVVKVLLHIATLKKRELIIVYYSLELELMNGCACPPCQMCSQLAIAAGILKVQESMFFHLWLRQVHRTV